MLSVAITNCTVLGLPRRQQVERKPEWKLVADCINVNNLITDEKPIADAAIHHYLQWSFSYTEILDNIDFCGIISCRDVADKLKEYFHIKQIESYIIAGESSFPGRVTEPHYPDSFIEIMRSICVPKGGVFLVGAGILGKIYCEVIRQKGGIAIDIGSIFDSWLGIHSRNRFRQASEMFELEHLKLHKLTPEERQQNLLNTCHFFNIQGNP